jgi:hypothetical protein
MYSLNTCVLVPIFQQCQPWFQCFCLQFMRDCCNDAGCPFKLNSIRRYSAEYVTVPNIPTYYWQLTHRIYSEAILRHTAETKNFSELRSRNSSVTIYKTKKTKLHGLSPRANYTDRATAAWRRSDCQLLRIEGTTWSAWRIPTAVTIYSLQYIRPPGYS